MWLAFWLGCSHAPPPAIVAAERGRGHELFTHTWVPHDPLSAGGDGLGPTYNEPSCVRCHNQGGPGGGGANHVNVRMRRGGSVLHRVVDGERLPTVLLEQFDLDLLGRINARANGVQRNAPALWGAGRVDGVPMSVIAMRAKDGTGVVAGRFGWKGQVETLASFVERACANGIGLQTPHEDQPGESGPGVDMDSDSLEALTAYVAALPRPTAVEHPEGEALFEQVGCSDCHVRQLGDVDGLYSDLLLHDLGPDLADETVYYGRSTIPLARMWRTPPLWGVADSGPWLHDGRAATLVDAITEHGGDADPAIDGWWSLSRGERQAVLAFLEGLVAPS